MNIHRENIENVVGPAGLEPATYGLKGPASERHFTACFPDAPRFAKTGREPRVNHTPLFTGFVGRFCAATHIPTHAKGSRK